MPAPMLYLTPHDRRKRLIRRLGIFSLFIAGLVLALLLDHTLWQALKTDRPITRRDWYWLLRLAGYLPTWLIVAAILCRAGHAAKRNLTPHALALAGSAALSGLFAEILKLIIARDRPGETGLHHYRGLFAGFADGSNLGMPSSHAAVAFGAAFTAARLFPGAGLVLIPLAAGCALTRLLMGDHFFSDVYVAAWLGCLSASICIPGSLIPRHPTAPARLG